MSNTRAPLLLTLADVGVWCERGLITPPQADAIRHYVEEHGPVAAEIPPGPERRRGLNLVSIGYYFGAFMILLAYTIFVGLQWEGMGALTRAAISGGTFLGLIGIGYGLRRAGYVTAGNLLIFAGVGIVPLLTHSAVLAAGLWPDPPAYRDLYRVFLPQWAVMAVAGIAAALVAVRLTRFPLLMLLVAFWCWYLSMNLLRWASGADTWGWDDGERLLGTLVGGVMLLVGAYLQRRTRQDYSLWLYLFGHIVVLTHLGALALDKEGPLGLAFAAVYLAFVIASVWLQRRVFLVFGAIGFYGYACYLAFDIFEGALGFTIGLAALGLLVVLSAVGYQRVLGPALARWSGRSTARA
jgi:hypothetical protein